MWEDIKWLFWIILVVATFTFFEKCENGNFEKYGIKGVLERMWEGHE